MKRTVTAISVFAIYFWFIVSGGLWLASARFLPDGVPHNVLIALLGIAFAGTFVWLLATQLRKLFAGVGSAGLEIAISAVNVGLLLLAFASIYQSVGFTDTTGPEPVKTHDFWTATYFSVVTFTTLGYGDMRPIGIGRLIACVEAFTGYVVLGIIASSAAEILKTQGRRRADHSEGKLEIERVERLHSQPSSDELCRKCTK